MEYHIYINIRNDDYKDLGKIHSTIVSLNFKKKSINKKYNVIEYQNKNCIINLIPHYERLGKDSTKAIFTFPNNLISEGQKKLKNLVARLKEDGISIKEIKDIRNKVINI